MAVIINRLCTEGDVSLAATGALESCCPKYYVISGQRATVLLRDRPRRTFVITKFNARHFLLHSKVTESKDVY